MDHMDKDKYGTIQNKSNLVLVIYWTMKMVDPGEDGLESRGR